MTHQELEESLRDLGLKEGDIVLLHSGLASLGYVEGGAETVVEAFLNVLGEAGTLVVPGFVNDAIPTAVKSHPRAVRSVAPTGVAVAIGGKAEAICRDHWKAETAHAEDTPYHRVADMDGYVCLLGVDQDRNTTLHTAEELLRLPYLKDTRPKEIDTPEGKVEASFRFFPGPHRDFIGLDRLFRESGKMTMKRIGNAVVRLMKSRDMIDVAVRAGKADPAFVLCDNPNCEDCVKQRADLRRARLQQERFRLVAAAQLAGRYVPEIVDNCRAAGIDHLELDVIHGRPVQALRAKELVSHITALQCQGVSVTHLRPTATTSDMKELFRAAAEADVPRIVLPLTSEAGPQVVAAQKEGLSVSFRNQGIDHQTACDLLATLDQNGIRVNFAFDAADFACAGRKPFLQCYRTRLRHVIDQLDVADATFDGAPQSLAHGNAEIKELISILRCVSFAGDMVLSARNRFVADLRRTADRFMQLLDEM